MSLKQKTQTWIAQGVITPEQAQAILAIERQRNSHFFTKISFALAASLIGLGIMLLIAANWGKLGEIVRLLGDFTLFAAFIATAYYAIRTQRTALREVMLIICSSMVGASIGLIAQVFHLQGGWTSFALSWALLSLPFVLFSRNLVLNTAWWVLFASSWGEDFWKPVLDNVGIHWWFNVFIIFACAAIAIISYFIHHLTKQHSKLAQGLFLFALFLTYAFVWYLGVHWGETRRASWRYENLTWLVVGLSHIMVMLFFAIRLIQAAIRQNLASFQRNAMMAELYIVVQFAMRYGDLFMAGWGFIFGGLLILLMIVLTKRLSSWTKKQFTTLTQTPLLQRLTDTRKQLFTPKTNPQARDGSLFRLHRGIIITLLAVPCFALMAWTVLLTSQRHDGRDVQIAIEGYDPRDLLSGHYIRYQHNWQQTDCTQFANNICPKEAFCEYCRFYISETHASTLDKILRQPKQAPITVVYSYQQGRKPVAKSLLIDGKPYAEVLGE